MPETGNTAPYKTTPVFDEVTLPEAIRSAHCTKAGVWGLLRVVAGEARLVFHEPHREVTVTPGEPAPIAPEAVHHVELADGCGSRWNSTASSRSGRSVLDKPTDFADSAPTTGFGARPPATGEDCE